MKIHTVAYFFSQSHLHNLYLGSDLPIIKLTNIPGAVTSFIHKSSDMELCGKRSYMTSISVLWQIKYINKNMDDWRIDSTSLFGRHNQLLHATMKLTILFRRKKKNIAVRLNREYDYVTFPFGVACKQEDEG